MSLLNHQLLSNDCFGSPQSLCHPFLRQLDHFHYCFYLMIRKNLEDVTACYQRHQVLSRQSRSSVYLFLISNLWELANRVGEYWLTGSLLKSLFSYFALLLLRQWCLIKMFFWGFEGTVSLLNCIRSCSLTLEIWAKCQCFQSTSQTIQQDLYLNPRRENCVIFILKSICLVFLRSSLNLLVMSIRTCCWPFRKGSYYYLRIIL